MMPTEVISLLKKLEPILSRISVDKIDFIYSFIADNPNIFDKIDTIESIKKQIKSLDTDKISTIYTELDNIISTQKAISNFNIEPNKIAAILSISKEIKNINNITDEIKSLHNIEKDIKHISSQDSFYKKIIQEIEDSKDIVKTLKDEISILLKEKQNIIDTIRDLKTNLNNIKKDISNIETKAAELSKDINLIKNLKIETYTSTPGSIKIDNKNNVIRIGIPPLPEKGDKGEPGKDGVNFQADAIGNKIERNNYDGRKKGFSFISLDTFPVMIYFKKSDEFSNWTKGQPIGFFDESEFKKILRNINK